jgi:hypothetical protein
MESRRRVVAGLTVAAVLLIVAGVAAVAIDADFGSEPSSAETGRQTALPSRSELATPSPLPTPVLSTSPGLTPSDAPSPSPSTPQSPRPAGFVLVGKSYVYQAGDGTSVPMPAIAGLRAALVDGRAFYYALTANSYGLKTGVYAGEFVPNVATQQANGSSAQTGGVVLVGRVVTRLLSDRLAQVAVPEQRWAVALPVDIRDSKKPIEVGFDGFGLHGWSDTPRVVVRFSGSLPVTNIIPDNAGYHVLVEPLGVTTWQVIDPTRLTLSSAKLDPAHVMNELLVYGTGAASVQNDFLFNRPVGIGRPMLNASDEVSVSLVVRGSRADLGPDRILAVGDVPVFVASS